MLAYSPIICIFYLIANIRNPRFNLLANIRNFRNSLSPTKNDALDLLTQKANP